MPRDKLLGISFSLLADIKISLSELGLVCGFCVWSHELFVESWTQRHRMSVNRMLRNTGRVDEFLYAAEKCDVPNRKRFVFVASERGDWKMGGRRVLVAVFKTRSDFLAARKMAEVGQVMEG